MRTSFLFFLASLFIILGNSFPVGQRLDFRVYPIKSIQFFHFGHKNTMADTFWLNTIQNMGYCEQGNLPSSYNAGGNLDEILTIDLTPSRCHKGWVFQMMDFITDLSPRFEAVYEIGATVLSVVVDDREGAKIIFDKGLEQYPNNWILNYRAAYHYLFDLQKPGRAADLLLAAYKNGGPDYLPTLASRLFSKVGRAMLGVTTLEEFIQNNPDSPSLERAKKRLSELKKDLDIKDNIKE